MKQESLKFSGRASNPATKKFSPAQIAAQRLFAERARAGTLGKTVKRKAAVKRNPVTPRGFVVADDYTREIFNPYGAKQYDAVFMKTTSEPGFSPYDLTILKLNSGEFIAATGSKVYQEKFTTAAAAANWLANWYKENKQKMYRGVKTNPDKSKPRAYVKRASQATGAPPSKRLVTRRKKALTAPAGYFPNPKAAKKPLTLQERSKKFKIELGFDKFKTFKKVVGYYPSDSSPDYELVALFQTQREAVSAGRTYAENYPKFRWFVKDL